MERTSTGIRGLDKLLEGGFPRGSTILLTGPSGSGKTIFGLQHLMVGARGQDEASALIQLEGHPMNLGWHQETFGWDFSTAQEKGLLAIYTFDPKDYMNFKPMTIKGQVISKIKAIAESLKISHMVIDSVTPIGLSLNDLADYRTALFYLIEFTKSMGITTVLVSENSEHDTDAHYSLSKHGVEEHVCDGVIQLGLETLEGGEVRKRMAIRKMAATDFPTGWYPVNITAKRGFEVKPFR